MSWEKLDDGDTSEKTFEFVSEIVKQRTSL